MRENKSLLKKAIRLLTVGVACFAFSGGALADQFDDQIAALKSQVNQQQSELNSLRAKEDTLQNKLAAINAQVAANQSKLRLTQAQYDKTTAELAASKAKLEQQRAVLGESLREIYLQGQVSTLEILASSGSFGEFLDRQQYLQNIKDRIQDVIDQVNNLKAQLETQQQEQVKILAEQNSLKLGLQQQQSEQVGLLSETQGQESVYQGRIAAQKKQIASLQAAQAASIVSARKSGGNLSLNSSYEAYISNPRIAGRGYDDWGYFLRECVSYVAWKRAAIGRPLPAWGFEHPFPYGSAKYWINYAPTDHVPEVGAVGVYTGGPYGHVVVVEQILNGGRQVRVSNYNGAAPPNDHRYSDQDIWDSSALYFIH